MERKQHKAKVYTDTKRRARNSEISIGSNVIVKQELRNKLTSRFDPKPNIDSNQSQWNNSYCRKKGLLNHQKCVPFQELSSKQRNASQRNDTGI